MTDKQPESVKQICEACGVEFKIIPPPTDMSAWRNCLRPKCPSYDPQRDLDR